MIDFYKLLHNDKDIKYIVDLIISTVSDDKSFIGIDFYENHILVCTEIAYKLAIERDANIKNAVIAALLHDYAMHDTKKDHEIIGGIYARKILNDLNFDKDDINAICQAIEHHRDGILKYKDKNDLIISDADAISYIIKFPFFEQYERKIHPKTADDILMNKIDKICDIITPGGLDLIKKDCERIKRRLEENKNEKSRSKRLFRKNS